MVRMDLIAELKGNKIHNNYKPWGRSGRYIFWKKMRIIRNKLTGMIKRYATLNLEYNLIKTKSLNTCHIDINRCSYIDVVFREHFKDLIHSQLGLEFVSVPRHIIRL